MGFKTVEQYNDDKYKGLFILENDGDFEDVIFLYRNSNEVLVADTHYIKSPEYSGYVHCQGRGCPACEKNIRIQTKLFIPLYIVRTGEVVFFDRSIRFESQLQEQVFANAANPSEYVFRITRHGRKGDINTSYDIRMIANNNVKSYEEICSEANISFPDYFETICRDIDSATLSTMLTAKVATVAVPSELPNYTVRPRSSSTGDAPAVAPAVSSSMNLDIVPGDLEELDEGDEPNFD